MKLQAMTAVVALGLFVGSAQAADLAPLPTNYGYYVSLFGGANFLESADVSIDPLASDLDDDFGRIGFDTGFVAGGTFGLEFIPGWRSEVELSYRKNDVSSYFEGTITNNLASSGDAIGALAIMANVWKDFHLSDNIGLHVGGGIGAANLDLTMANVDDTDPLASINDDAWVLAGQAGAGFSWALGNNMVATIDYRFFITDKATFNGVDNDDDPFTFSHDYMSHSVMAGLRIPLGGN